MKKDIRYIYFDIDDTILDHKSAERAGLQDTHDNLEFLQPIPLQELWDVYHSNNKKLWKDYGAGRIDREFLEHSRFAWTLRDLGIETSNTTKMRETYMQYYEDHWEWIPGAKEALAVLSKQYSVGFLTNGFAEVQQKKAEKFGLFDLTENYIISENVGFMKPMPGIFEYATRMAEVQPEEILYVGDSFISDIEGGSAFGWKTAWFTNSQDASQTKKATFAFDDFDLLVRTVDRKNGN